MQSASDPQMHASDPPEPDEPPDEPPLPELPELLELQMESGVPEAVLHTPSVQNW